MATVSMSTSTACTPATDDTTSDLMHDVGQCNDRSHPGNEKNAPDERGNGNV